MKNCLYVGSFNPITKAHLKISKDLLKSKIIDNLYFIPVNSKKNDLVPIKDRINMINLVITKNMQVLNIYNYTKLGYFNYNILNLINKDININYILIGSDLFLKFKSFIYYQDILNNYYLIIIKRDNIDINKLIEKEYNLYKNKIIIINKNYLGSSTIVRNNLKNKDKKIKYLDNKVLGYIKDNKLYENN